jgi:hypothetical protein
MNFSTDMSKKSSARHSLTIRSKVTLSRILEATNNSLRIEINDEGTIGGRSPLFPVFPFLERFLSRIPLFLFLIAVSPSETLLRGNSELP